jgi:hypothetical protein
MRALACFSQSGNGLAEARVTATTNTVVRVKNFIVIAGIELNYFVEVSVFVDN